MAAVVHGRVGERHGEVRAAVEGALEGDDARAAGHLLGELDGVLDGLGAGVGEHDLVQALGHDAGELLGQLEHRAVPVDVHLRVRHLGGLLLHGLDDLGVAVAGVDHGDADHEVEPLAAVGVVDPTPLGVVDGDRRHRPEEVGHVLHVRGLVRHVVTSSCDGAACVTYEAGEGRRHPMAQCSDSTRAISAHMRQVNVRATRQKGFVWPTWTMSDAVRFCASVLTGASARRRIVTEFTAFVL